MAKFLFVLGSGLGNANSPIFHEHWRCIVIGALHGNERTLGLSIMESSGKVRNALS